MKFIKKVMKFSTNSFGVLIPKEIIDEEEIQEGDIIEVDVQLPEKTKSYRCSRCEHHFDLEEDIPYCPICGEDGENIVLIDEDKTERRSN
jgi:rubrerythrin